MSEHIRIEHAETPHEAAQLAFGRGTVRFEYLDMGSRVSVVRNQKQRVALLTSDAWQKFE